MANQQKIKLIKKLRRQARIRAKIFGTATLPRLSVFRSLEHLNLQLIDDEKGRTLVSVNDRTLKIKGSKMVRAEAAGKLLAERALEKKIKQCIFDKSSYHYHGRVKAVADGARAGGLKF